MVLEVLSAIAKIGPDITGQFVTAQVFQNLLGNLNQLGFFQFLLPFLLFLAIIFGVLRWGVPQLDKTASALVAIIGAFFVLNFSGGVGISIALFFTNLFGSGIILLSGILIIIIFLGLIGIKVSDLFKIEGGKVPGRLWAFMLLLVFIGVLIFIGAGGGNLLSLPTSFGGFTGGDVTAMIFFLIILGIAVWFLGQEGEKTAKPPGT